MNVIWRECNGIFLLMAFIISSTPTPTQGVRWSMCLNQSQIEGVLKRFKTSGSYEDKLNQILGCLGPSRDGCNGEVDEYLTNEILVRGQMREMGEDCTSGGGKYSKPFFNNIFQSLGKEYKQFQEKLLDTGLTFCNPFKHLYCSPLKKCECRPGTILKPDVNPDVCNIVIPGGYCVDPGSEDWESRRLSVALYDPFNLDGIGINFASIVIPPPQCLKEDGLQCRTLDYFHRRICANDAIVEFDKKLVEHFKDLPRLNFGDPCNSELHEELLKSPEAEWSDYTIRVKKLEEIMGAKTQFCDLRRVLVCGNNSGKCECIKPTFYDEKTKNCTYKHPHELCAQVFVMRDFAANLTGNASSDAKAGYESVRQRDCPGGCTLVEESRVLCSVCDRRTELGKTGRNCDKNLTLFLSGEPQVELPRDEPDWGKQIDLLTDLSDNATELEKILRLDEGSLCDLVGELKTARVIRRIKNVEVAGTVATKEYYREVIRSIDSVISQYRTGGLCRYPERTVNKSYILEPRPDLVCGPTATNPKCYKPNNVEYLEILRKRLIPFQTLTEGQPCPIDVDKLFQNAMYLFGTNHQNERSYHQFLIPALETYFVNETQFCNSKSGLECDRKFLFVSLLTAKGKCGFTEETKKKNEMKKSGDLRANAPHFIQVSFVVILVILY